MSWVNFLKYSRVAINWPASYYYYYDMHIPPYDYENSSSGADITTAYTVRTMFGSTTQVFSAQRIHGIDLVMEAILWKHWLHMRSLSNKTLQRNTWVFISGFFVQCLRTLPNDWKFREYSLFLGRRKKTENKKCKILDTRCFNVQRHHPYFWNIENVNNLLWKFSRFSRRKSDRRISEKSLENSIVNY